MSMAHNFLEPQEEKYSEWFNPLEIEQYVDISVDGGPRKTRFRWKPKETLRIPSRFDGNIHVVSCDDDTCKRRPPGFCTNKHHRGVIIGGQAPHLRDKDAHERVIDSALDMFASRRKSAEQQAEIAAIQKRAAEEVLLAAQVNLAQAQASAKAEAEAHAEAKVDPKDKRPGKA